MSNKIATDKITKVRSLASILLKLTELNCRFFASVTLIRPIYLYYPAMAKDFASMNILDDSSCLYPSKILMLLTQCTHNVHSTVYSHTMPSPSVYTDFV